ncbi:MAG: adenosine 5-monophosphoramidase [Caulobacteraceae bacterium]|nr:adenosine 5-monophosphoramidase [Caulobacteraceae bacterium]
MSLSGAYDEANVFARILRGEIPCAKIYEDDQVLAFMDVFPQTRGHSLVISKASKARNILEVEPAVLADLIAATQKIAAATYQALSPDGLVITQFNGAEAGQTVFHLHFHIIPRFAGEPVRDHAARMADAGDLGALARRIASAL